MALAIQRSRTPSVKGRLLSTLIMAFALMLQPMYGMVAGQVASATSAVVTTQAELENALNDGSRATVTISGNITVTKQINVTRAVTLTGGTLTAGFSGSPSNDAVLLVNSGSHNVRVENLTVDGANKTGIQGVQVYQSSNVYFYNLTVKNNKKAGLNVNGSTVRVDNITTANNGFWFGGIHLDQGSGVVAPTHLTIGGKSNHSGEALWDLRRISGTVTDENLQYNGSRLKSAPRPVNITSPVNDSTESGSHDVTVSWEPGMVGSSIQEVIKYQYTVQLRGGSDYVANVSDLNTSQRTHTVTVPSNGLYDVNVYAFSRTGLMSSASASFTVDAPVGDVTPPTFEITNLENDQLVGTANTNKLVIKGTLTDPSGARALIQLVKPGVGVVADNVTVHAPVEDGTLAEFSTAGLASGAYELHVRPTDYKGNAVPFFVISFAIDNVLPNISISSSQGDAASKIFREVSFKLHDSGKIDRAELNGKPFTSNRGSVWGDLNNVWANRGWSGAHEGENTLVLFDMAGNQVSYNFTIDRTAPTATFTFSNNNGNALTSEDVVVTMTSSEAIQTPAGWNPVGDEQKTFTRSYSNNGKQEVVITDLAGNVSAPQKFEVKRIDRNAPTITGVADGAVVKGPIELTVFDPKYQGYDGFDQLNGLTVNGTKVSTMPGSGKTYRYLIFAEGAYTVVATDKAGNSTTIEFTVDNTAPIVEIDGVVDGEEYDAPVTVLGTITDENLKNYYLTVMKDGVRINIPGVAQNGSADRVEFTLSEVGSYVVKLEARDKAGNKEGTSDIDGISVKTVSFTIINPLVGGDDGEIGTGGETGAPGGASSDNEDEDEDSDTQAAQPFANPFFFANQGVLGDQDTEADPVDDSEVEGVVAGEQDDSGTPLTDTATFGMDAPKLLGLVWYWWVAIVAALVSGWLAVAAAIRRSREEEA